MDRGGRVAEPLNAGTSGVQASRASRQLPNPVSPLDRLAQNLLRSIALPRFGRRRSSVSIPLVRRLPRLAGTYLALAFFAAIGGYGLVANGGYAELTETYGDPSDLLARAVGLGLDKVTISGIARLSEVELLQAAGISNRNSLAFLDVAKVRRRLLDEPFIKSASVRKLYPNELSIAIVEREPFALWQLNGELYVVADDGTQIDQMRDPGLVDLPLVVGEGANLKAAEYAAILDAAGPLKAKIRAGMLISGRRWTLKMHNGLDVRLPEENAVAAMHRLARLDREAGLLSKDVLTVDLRMPDRIVLRLTEEAVAARQEGTKKKIQRGVKGIDT
jgi:cell division protein FtsQ